MKKSIVMIISFLFLAAAINAQNKTELANWLESIEGIEIKTIAYDSTLFNESYELMLTQPLDHKNPGGKTFKQQIFLSHVDKNQPVILETEGYAAFNFTHELSRILNANQIIVEHRFFEESSPDSMDCQFLTTWQAATDHHKITELFKKFYSGKWINTGISKGGQTTIYHKYFYPEDVDVSIPYVAPLNFSDADPRIHSFLELVSTTECRSKVFEFQKTLLSKRDEIQPLFQKFCEKEGYIFNIPLNEAYEYCVLEYSFAYWQWGGGNCSSIPDSTADAQKLFEEFGKYGIFGFISEDGIQSILPFYYQAFTEIGFYDYDIKPFGNLIKFTDGSNKIFYDESWDIEFDFQAMKNVKKWLDKNGNNFIYIYGENDPWSATSVELNGITNAVKIVNPGGAHWTRISNLPDELKQIVYNKLSQWLNVDLTLIKQ